MKYKITVRFNPQSVLQHYVFLELAQLIKYSLEDLGHQVDLDMLGEEHNPLATNILVGIHTFSKRFLDRAPYGTIGINTEQLIAEEMSWDALIIEFSKKNTVWDYNHFNVEFLKSRGAIDVHYLRLGFHPKLNRIPKAEKQDIDVLMYGSFNERRTNLCNSLKDRGFRVEALHKVFGEHRDKFIGRSKIVLNAHYFKSQIFESVRGFYLLSNSKAIVCEVNSSTLIDPAYLPAMEAVPYEALVESCCRLLKSKDELLELERKALQTIQSLSMVEWLEKLLKVRVESPDTFDQFLKT